MRTLTPTQEDYLRAIYYLHQKHQREVRPVEVARYLNLAKQTVTERLQNLVKNGLVAHEHYGKITLTKRAEEIAQKLTYKHRLIEVFLHTLLKRPKNKVHEEAHKLEHAFTDESISSLKDLLGNPKVDPHGQPIRTR